MCSSSVLRAVNARHHHAAPFVGDWFSALAPPPLPPFSSGLDQGFPASTRRQPQSRACSAFQFRCCPWLASVCCYLLFLESLSSWCGPFQFWSSQPAKADDESIPRCLPSLHGEPHPARFQVYPKSSKPYEVEWRPYDSGGVDLALNPQKRIALTPRLFVTNPETFEKAEENDPPAGTAPKGEFQEAHKKFKLTVPPIGSWSIVKADEPWGQLGPFAL